MAEGRRTFDLGSKCSGEHLKTGNVTGLRDAAVDAAPSTRASQRTDSVQGVHLRYRLCGVTKTATVTESVTGSVTERATERGFRDSAVSHTDVRRTSGRVPRDNHGTDTGRARDICHGGSVTDARSNAPSIATSMLRFLPATAPKGGFGEAFGEGLGEALRITFGQPWVNLGAGLISG